MPHDWAQALVQERLAAMQQDQPVPNNNRNDKEKDTDGVHVEDSPGTTTDPSETTANTATSVPPATALTRHYEQRNEYLQTTLPRRKWKAWHTFVSVRHCWPYPPHHVGYVDVAVVDLYDGGEPSFPACWKHFRQDMVQHFGQHKPVQGWTLYTALCALIHLRHTTIPALWHEFGTNGDAQLSNHGSIGRHFATLSISSN